MEYNLSIVIARMNPTLVGFTRAIVGNWGANSENEPLT